MSAAKSPLINLVIILLVAAVLALLCVPCYVTEGDSASVMSYIFMNTEHDGVTGLLEESNPDFLLNGQVWMPILLFLLGIVTIFMIITKWNLTNSLLFPIVFSVFGMLTVWTNELTRLGGVTLWPTVLMIITIALSLFNGDWFAGQAGAVWKKDSSARGKLKQISRAVEKKNIAQLQAHAQSTDPELRIAAVNGLAEVGGNGVFQPLIAQLSCPHPDVRIAAAAALGKLGEQRGRSFLLHYMNSDPDTEVRKAMRKALANLPSCIE